MKKEFPWALVMLQPEALPGSYLNKGKPFGEILDSMLCEADMIASMGFDGFILQNMHDGPVSQQAKPETVAFMTRLGTELRRRFRELIIGILVNWDGLASLAVAEAAEADFVRVEHLYTGVSVANTGFMYGQCEELCTMRKRLGTGIPVFADVQEVNSTYVVPKPKAEAAVDAVRGAFADGIFISGSDIQESIDYAKEIKNRLPGIPVMLGGGATGENIQALMRYYDGVSVATWIKNGDMRNPIDPIRAQKFLKEFEAARKLKHGEREK